MNFTRIVNYNEGINRIRKKPLTLFLNKIPNDLIIRIKKIIHPEYRFRKKISAKYNKNNEIVYNLILDQKAFK